MSDVITKFKLETTQFDSKLKSSAKELANIGKDAMQAGRDFQAFTSKSIESARALGNVSTSANTTKGKVQELVGAYNEAAKAYNMLSAQQKQSDWAKAMSDSLTKLSERIRDAKNEMQNMPNPVAAMGGGSGGGLGSMMQNALSVFGGNLMTKAATAAADFGREMVGCVKEGIELARQGEGVRNAFERLGRGDILDNLRKATHGTVTDLELMKAAVQFNDFRLPLDQLGTMLAFAQQKAKDTGQSVDYMVNSIVTGLGRKSKLILDNLGISASELDEEMKKTGDMTLAVGNIIRRQMASAGDYIETAADKAAQANVNLQNKMEELGRKFAPVEEASSQLWTSMKIGILDLVGGPLAKLLNSFTEAGRLKNALNDINGGDDSKQTLAQRKLGVLRHYSGSQKGVTKQTVYDRTMAGYNKEEEKANRAAMYYRNKRLEAEKKIRGVNVRRDESGVQAGFLKKQVDSYRQKEIESRNRAQAIRLSREEYRKGAQQILNPSKNTNANATTPTSLSALRRKLSGLEKELAKAKKAGNLERVKEINKQITEVKGDIKEYEPNAFKTTKQKEGKEDVYAADSIRAQQKLVEELTQKWQRCSTEMRDGYLNKLNQAKEKLDEMQGKVVVKEKLTKDLEQGISNAYKSVREQFAQQMGAKQNAFGDILPNPEGLLFNKNGIPKDGVAEAGTAAKESWQDAARAISAAGGALAGIQEPGIKVAAIVGQAIANIALGFATSTSQEGKKGFWWWLAAVAGGLGTMIGTIASIKSATSGSYASGGIIPGNSYSGDNLIANVNAGELILNKAQQRNVAAALSGNNPMGNLRLETAITDRQIVVMLRGYENRYGKL